METRQLFTLQDAAVELGISRLTLSKWQKDGKVMPLGMVGKVYVFDAEYISQMKERITKHVPFRPRLSKTGACKQVN